MHNGLPPPPPINPLNTLQSSHSVNSLHQIGVSVESLNTHNTTVDSKSMWNKKYVCKLSKSINFAFLFLLFYIFCLYLVLKNNSSLQDYFYPLYLSISNLVFQSLTYSIWEWFLFTITFTDMSNMKSSNHLLPLRSNRGRSASYDSGVHTVDDDVFSSNNSSQEVCGF